MIVYIFSSEIPDNTLIDVDNFMDELDSGVYLCQLSKILQAKAEEASREGGVTEVISASLVDLC